VTFGVDEFDQFVTEGRTALWDALGVTA